MFRTIDSSYIPTFYTPVSLPPQGFAAPSTEFEPNIWDQFGAGASPSGFVPSLMGPAQNFGALSYHQLNSGVPGLLQNAQGLDMMQPAVLMQLEQLKQMLMELLIMYLMLGGPQQQRGRDLGKMKSAPSGQMRRASWSPSNTSGGQTTGSGSTSSTSSPGTTASTSSAPTSSTATGANVSGSTGATGNRALDWSAAQMNPATANGVNSNNGRSLQDDPTAWDNWCLAFVSTAHGRAVPELAAGSAIRSFEKFQAAGKISQNRNNIPPGAPVFFQATQANGGYGHVAINTGRTTPSGDPIIRTTGWPGRSGVWEVPLSQLEQMSGGFIGWGQV